MAVITIPEHNMLAPTQIAHLQLTHKAPGHIHDHNRNMTVLGQPELRHRNRLRGNFVSRWSHLFGLPR